MPRQRFIPSLLFSTFLLALGTGRQLYAAGESQPARIGSNVWVLGSPCELYRVDRRATESRTCLTCHDGTTMPGSTPLKQFGATGGSKHAIGTDYMQASSNRFLKLLPAAYLPSEIVLVNNSVECTTCHAANGHGPKRLALPRSNGRLCLACHNK